VVWRWVCRRDAHRLGGSRRSTGCASCGSPRGSTCGTPKAAVAGRTRRHIGQVGRGPASPGDIDLALDHFRYALTIGRRIGDRRFESETLNNIGLAQLARGNPAAALDSFRQALTVCRGQADQQGESLVLNNLGKARLALECLRRKFRRPGSANGPATTGGGPRRTISSSVTCAKHS
jgi:hypothetical protein